MTIDLEHELRVIEAFDTERWEDHLSQAQQDVQSKLASFEARDASRYSEEGKQQKRARIVEPEVAARQRAAAEAEGMLARVAEARALLDKNTGLTDAQLRLAETQRWRYEEDARNLPADQLARKIAADVHLADKPGCWLWMRYGELRLNQLHDEVSTSADPGVRSRARAAIEALRPALEAAQKAIESPVAERLRKAIAEGDTKAQKLRARAMMSSPSEQIAQKRASGVYEL